MKRKKINVAERQQVLILKFYKDVKHLSNSKGQPAGTSGFT